MFFKPVIKTFVNSLRQICFIILYIEKMSITIVGSKEFIIILSEHKQHDPNS